MAGIVPAWRSHVDDVVTHPYLALRHDNLHNPTVFTCIFGNRQQLHTSVVEFPNKVVYSDRSLDLPGWEHRPIIFWDNVPKNVIIFHKFQIPSLRPDGHKLIWVDSRISVEQFVFDDIVMALDQHDLCLFKHYARDCVYEEADAVAAAGRALPAECSEFKQKLHLMEFPRHGGLFETGVMGIKVSPQVRRCFGFLFGQAYLGVARDQLVLPLALQAFPLTFKVYGDGHTNLRNTRGITVQQWI